MARHGPWPVVEQENCRTAGGRVGMTSEPGVGSTFFVTIPIRFGEPPSETGMSQAPVQTVDKRTSHVRLAALPACSWWTTIRPPCMPTSRGSTGAGFRVLEAGDGTGSARRPCGKGDPRSGRARREPPRLSTGSRSAGGCGALAKMQKTPVIHLSATFVKDVDKVQGLEGGPTAT